MAPALRALLPHAINATRLGWMCPGTCFYEHPLAPAKHRAHGCVDLKLDLASPTRGRIVAALKCSLSAGRTWPFRRKSMFNKHKCAAQMHGPKNWSLIAGGIQGRSGKSCRLRWCNQLDPGVIKDPFSEWEDAVIINAHIVRATTALFPPAPHPIREYLIIAMT